MIRTLRWISLAAFLFASPVAAQSPPTRTITLTFDYIEAGGSFDWTRETAMGNDHKRNMSIIHEENGVEIFRTNYFETFPIIYQQFTGFAQVEKVKVRLVISYDFSELG